MNTPHADKKRQGKLTHDVILFGHFTVWLLRQALRNRLFLPFVLWNASQVAPLTQTKVPAFSSSSSGLLGETAVCSVAASAAVCKTFWSGYQRCHFHCGCTCPCNRALFVYSSCDRYCSPHASVHKANGSCAGLIVFEAQEEEPLHDGTVCFDHHTWLRWRSLMGFW